MLTVAALAGSAACSLPPQRSTPDNLAATVWVQSEVAAVDQAHDAPLEILAWSPEENPVALGHDTYVVIAFAQTQGAPGAVRWTRTSLNRTVVTNSAGPGTLVVHDQICPAGAQCIDGLIELSTRNATPGRYRFEQQVRWQTDTRTGILTYSVTIVLSPADPIPPATPLTG